MVVSMTHSLSRVKPLPNMMDVYVALFALSTLTTLVKTQTTFTTMVKQLSSTMLQIDLWCIRDSSPLGRQVNPTAL